MFIRIRLVKRETEFSRCALHPTVFSASHVFLSKNRKNLHFTPQNQSQLGKTPTEFYWGREVLKKAECLFQKKINKSTP